MVTSSADRLWIKASPRGTRSGFAVLPDGVGGKITVTVLPKPWSVATEVVREHKHVPGTTTHIVLYETELAAISAPPTAIGSLTMSLMETARSQADLLSLGTPPDESRVAPAIDGDPFAALLDLMLLAERGSLANSPLTFEGALSPSFLRLLTQERLLSLVEDLIFRARPRYSERTETLAMPRGRLSEDSLLYSLATGTPRVESTFDELTTDTPLLRVMASALRVIASDRLPRKIAALRPGLQARAVHLLRFLSGVTLIDRERAILLAESLWLGPLDQLWKPAIDAALPVLLDWAVEPETGDTGTDALLVHISTEKFWEQCLEMALQSAFSTLAVSRDALPGIGVSVPAPWVSSAADGDRTVEPPTTSFPDFMLRAGHQVVVADAKYKLGTGRAPGASDGYQLFAYSHLATLDGRLSDLAVLLYPTRANGRVGQAKLERLRDRTYPLWIVRLPFPRPIDLREKRNWTAYIADLAGHLRRFAGDWADR
ncbi:McrC family protein [Kocuria palustris]|uniref:McrC family protein n=1 Tax=Kocuria palustris TaxID=71999 RepID=UPI0021A4742B|nr:McrC family protein [Kocuria palustris]MCT1833304.1 McrC family protein [Kocuria palustris]MDH5150896.1 McrC family protein [Kocuria palustris]